MMKTKKIFALFIVVMFTLSAYADIDLKATYYDKNGEVTTSEDFSGEAPLFVRFTSNVTNLPSGASIEWHIQNQSTGTNLTRYEEDIEFNFVEAGLTSVTVQVVLDNEVLESATIRVTITESHLEMPNAFSPNGDNINDIYKAKSGYPTNTSGYRSIVEFHAYIFNRYGQKLYEWTDLDGGWDGTHNGHPVKDGVYFVYVKARGADGKEYNIRRDVNLIRKFNEVENTNNP